MRKSKLESYEIILGALMKRPLTIDSLAYRVGMDCNILSEYLTFLRANGVVEEQDFGERRLFALTERGVTVFRTLDFQKYLKKLTKKVMMGTESVHDVPLVLKHREKLRK